MKPNARADEAFAEGYDSLVGASDPNTTWSTTNVAEAMPGVLTPLNWSVWGPAAEMSIRRSFNQIGALELADVRIPSRIEERIFGVFHGRIAIQGDFFCEMGNRLPGTSGAAVAEQLFAGATPEDFESTPVRRYYLKIAVGLPRSFLRSPALVRQAREETQQWYEVALRRIETADIDLSIEAFTAAVRRFHENVFRQAYAALSGVQPVFDKLQKLAELGGEGASGVMAGYGSHEELELVSDLWACSRGQLEIDTLVARHGYHGPLEGEASAIVWREDPAPLKRIVDGYRAKDDSSDPVWAATRRRMEREAAERNLLAALPMHRRPVAKLMTRLARSYIPLRAVGKVAFLQSLDIVRASARRIGARLEEHGWLLDSEDIFYLTTNEIIHREWDGAIDIVASRREQRERFQRIQLPVAWRGMPEVQPDGTSGDEDSERPAGAEARTELHGIGTSAGVVEGRVLVVQEPGDADIREGDILVAHTTDPSWASIMFLASALVMDVGGQLSHAAVVARELGIPCVANTKTGTDILHTGDCCRVDGGTGRVEILARASSTTT
jgi:phosphohistidine swiveling domain-containing protein